MHSRFNPARAGNMAVVRLIIQVMQVQPRPCGEYKNAKKYQQKGTGSTPPVRGILTIDYKINQTFRFNPARAGNIGRFFQGARFLEVQPRPCGEYYNSRKSFFPYQGSTPPVRGIFMFFIMSLIAIRFNPARAGNIGMQRSFQALSQVQPRPCGEYTKNIMK